MLCRVGPIHGTIGTAEAKKKRGRALTGSLSFIFGFSVVFVSLGALFGEFGAHLQSHERALSIGAGLVTILLGLFFAGWLPSTWMARERRWHVVPSASVLGAFVLGFFFAVGWAPCIGPTLQSIQLLELSSSKASALHGSLLAAFYCVGLGIPFVVFALASEWAATTSRWLRRHQRVVGAVGGLLLVTIGVMEVSGTWQQFVIWLRDHVPAGSSPL